MKTVRFKFLALVCALCFASPLLSQQISIDTTSARAMLTALHDPNLTYEQAIHIAKL